jgi:NAD(P)-dependent dehydrogenase (short-subunit alcohol dehydrogenase family)
MTTLDAFRLDGRVAVVTGASRGIGRALALALADAGADLALASRSAEGLEAVSAEVAARGGRALAVPTDVADVAQVRRLVERTVEAFGRLDVLVNNAGLNIRRPALEFTEQDWDAIHAVQLRGVFFACQAAGRVMVQQGYGKIINIASLTSVIGIKHVVPYAAAKGGVVQLTKALAVEWAPLGVRVNAIGPGYIETDLTQPLFQDPERSAWIHSRIPLGRRGYPADLMGAAVFLASPASDYVTGQVLYVDGGWLAG